MTTRRSPYVLAVALIGLASTVAPAALASNPLEYPDNGAAAFSRGGAWLATGNEPIAAHYDPAALAIQTSAFSIDQNLAYDKVCYSRQGPNSTPESTGLAGDFYLPACNGRTAFPSTIPSIAVSLRVSEKLGIGMAIVPPSTYAGADNAYPPLATGFNLKAADCLASGKPASTCGSPYVTVPAPYRYQQLQQLSTILFPTVSVGYAILPTLRIGVGFISGIGVINNSVAAIQSTTPPGPGQVATDNPGADAISTLHTKDLFMPGVVVSVHWSPTPMLDVAAWGRWISPLDSSTGDLSIQTQPFDSTGATTSTKLQPTCQANRGSACYNNALLSPINQYGNDAFRHFKFPFPPEVRVGVRFHRPRAGVEQRPFDSTPVTRRFTSRDPLHDDLFDVELDGSYSFNTAANTIEIRFAEANGGGTAPVKPIGEVPPNADIWNGYENSFGLRLGGQWNAIRDVLGLRAGTWLETQSQRAEWLEVYPVGATRGGFGGGVVVRQDFVDISVGYQYQWSAGLDNGGVGARRAVQAVGGTAFNLSDNPPGSNAGSATQFRSYQTVNDGNVIQHAHVFTLGGTVRY